MFIISANRLNMFREGNALPSPIGGRFMGSFEVSQIAATSDSAEGAAAASHVLWGCGGFGVEKKHAVLRGVSMFSGVYLQTVCVRVRVCVSEPSKFQTSQILPSAVSSHPDPQQSSLSLDKLQVSPASASWW